LSVDGQIGEAADKDFFSSQPYSPLDIYLIGLKFLVKDNRFANYCFVFDTEKESRDLS
jgi:hypothetical protein